MTVKTHKNSSYFSLNWDLGECNGPKSKGHYDAFADDANSLEYYEPNNTFIDRCCVPPEPQVLICHNHKGPFGWGGSFLEILGQRYCDDFIGFKAMRRVNIFGRIDILFLNRRYNNPTNLATKLFCLPLIPNIIASVHSNEAQADTNLPKNLTNSGK